MLIYYFKYIYLHGKYKKHTAGDETCPIAGFGQHRI